MYLVRRGFPKVFSLFSIAAFSLQAQCAYAREIYFSIAEHSAPITSARIFSADACTQALTAMTKLTPADELVRTWEDVWPAPPFPAGKYEERFRRENLGLEEKLKKLLITLRCFNPHPPFSSAHQAYESQYSLPCESKWLSPFEANAYAERRKSLLVNQRALLRQLAQAERLPEFAAEVLTNSYSQKQTLRALFSDEAAEALYDRDKIQSAFELASRGRMEEASSQVLSAIPNSLALLRRWKELDRSRELEKVRRQKIRLAQVKKRYEMQRLVFRYRAFALKSPGGSIPEFCLENYATQMVDDDFKRVYGFVHAFQGPEQWEMVANYGVSEAELSAMRIYTSSGYSETNDALRMAKRRIEPQPLTERASAFVFALSRGLDRLPPYLKKPVVRYSDLPLEILAEHVEGAIVTYAAPTSASRVVDWNWKGGRAHKFSIHNRGGGKDVDVISMNPGEGEVLFPPGTHFRVISRRARPGTEFFDFILEEVRAEPSTP